MAADIEVLKSELTGYVYKKIPNLPVIDQLSSLRYLFTGKNFISKLASTLPKVRYQLMTETLTASQLTVTQYAITYNDLNFLQELMRGFTSDQKYSVLAQQIIYELSGMLKVGSTLEYMLDILCEPLQFPGVKCDIVENIAGLLLHRVNHAQRLQLANNDQILTRLIDNASWWSVMQKLFYDMSYEGICKIFRLKKKNGQTFLEMIIFQGKFEILDFFRSELTERFWFLVLQERFDEETPVQLAIKSDAAHELLRYMLREFTSYEIVEVLRPVSMNYQTCSPELEKYLNLMMELTSEEVRVNLLEMPGQEGNTLLHLVAIAERGELLNSLLGDLSECQIFQILNVSNYEGCTVLHIALSTWRLRSIKSTLCIFKRLCKEDQLTLIRHKWKGQTLVHVVAERNSSEMFHNLLSGISDQKLRHLFELQNAAGMTALHCVVNNTNVSTALLKYILEKTGKQKHRFLSLQCNNKMTPVHYAVNKLDIAVCLLEGLPEDQLYAVVSIPDLQGDTILHKLPLYCDHFKTLFSMLSLRNQSKFLHLRNSSGSTILQGVATNPTGSPISLRSITSSGIKLEALVAAYAATTASTEAGKYL